MKTVLRVGLGSAGQAEPGTGKELRSSCTARRRSGGPAGALDDIRTGQRIKAEVGSTLSPAAAAMYELAEVI
jgi:hypothetical protein